MKNAISYLDVSNDPDADKKAFQAPDLRCQILDLGFSRVGLLKTQVNDPGLTEALRASLHPEDANTMIEGIEQCEITEVLGSSDGQAFATVERLIGDPLVSFQTIFDNGLIVETTMKPLRAPRSRPISLRQQGPLGVLEQISMAALTGKPPIWARPNRPSFGYFVELVDTRSTAQLWQRHRERTAEKMHANGLIPPSERSLQAYIAIHKRFRQTTTVQAVRASVLTWVIVITWIIALLTMPFSKNLLRPGMANLPAFAGMMALFVISFFLVMAFLQRFILPRIPIALIPLQQLIRLPD